MKPLMLIALGGSLGAVLRYWLSGVLQAKTNSMFPVGTLAVNLLGCLLLGALMALVTNEQALRPEWRQFLGIGILGAFTTFSTFSYETVALIDGGAWAPALANVVLSVAGGLLMLLIGRGLVLWLAG